MCKETQFLLKNTAKIAERNLKATSCQNRIITMLFNPQRQTKFQLKLCLNPNLDENLAGRFSSFVTEKCHLNYPKNTKRWNRVNSKEYLQLNQSKQISFLFPGKKYKK